MKTIYQVFTYDESRRHLHSLHESDADANAVAAYLRETKQGGYDTTVEPIILYSSFEQWKDRTNQEARKRALDKLTLNERKLLGLE